MKVSTAVSVGLLPISRVLVTVLMDLGEDKYWKAQEDHDAPTTTFEGIEEELGAGVCMLATILMTILLMRKGKGGVLYVFLFHGFYTWLLHDEDAKSWPYV